MYIAYGSEDMGEKAMGMTAIHLDMVDMVNIMMFAVDPQQNQNVLDGESRDLA